MSNISLITKLGLIVTTAGALTVGVRYTSNFDNIEEAITTLRDRGVAYYNMATTSKEELATLQSKYDNLNTIYLGVLDELALEEGATIEEIKTKINDMVSEGNTETLNAIGALIGLEGTVTADNVTEALNSMNEQLTTLETKVSTLEAELAQARADLTQANSEQEQITALLESCMAEVPAIEEEEDTGTSGGDSGEIEGDTTTEGEELTEEQQALKATMNEAWQVVLDNNNENLDSEYMERLRIGTYTLLTSNSKNEVGFGGDSSSWKTIDWSSYQALQEYQTARDNFINAGGVL